MQFRQLRDVAQVLFDASLEQLGVQQELPDVQHRELQQERQFALFSRHRFLPVRGQDHCTDLFWQRGLGEVEHEDIRQNITPACGVELQGLLDCLERCFGGHLCEGEYETGTTYFHPLEDVREQHVHHSN